MRYLAYRVGTGEWISRDLPLSDVERTRNLSGPDNITATITPELRQEFHTDGMRVLEEWGTVIVAADDRAGQVRNCGIFTDASYEDESLTATIMGFTGYPHGYYYGDSRNWGPDTGLKLLRPDPLVVYRDLWDWIQAQPDSDLGVVVVGDLSSTARVGTYAEPYRLRSWEVPDIGEAMDTLASGTPFDYAEEHAWADNDQDELVHRVRLGWPRLGTTRRDLRFASGENIIAAVPAATTAGTFANDVLGIGNGEGSTMALAHATVRNGRLRRTRVVTDKTLRQAALQELTTSIRERTSQTLDITAVQINARHKNAPLSNLDLGDDIYVQTRIASFGDVRMWVRVTAITEDETGDTATLTTSRSSNFLYSATTEVT